MNYTEPLELTAGDQLVFTKVLSDYPAGDGWVLKYAFRIKATGGVKDVTAGTDGDSHVVNASTSGWPAGTWQVQGYVEKGGERYTIYRGELVMLADLVSADATYDGRSHARKVLDAIEATIEGSASKDQLKLEVDGDAIEKRSFDELMSLRSRYKREVKAEQRKALRKQGRSGGRVMKVSL